MTESGVAVRINPGSIETEFHAELASLVRVRFAQRLWAKDTSLFGTDRMRTEVVANRLGWLDSPDWLEGRVRELEEFAAQVRRDGIRHVVLLGMGGSSLCPEVLSLVFGLPGHLSSFDILDSTAPEAILRIERRIDPGAALFIVASKSGSTVETRSQAAYFLKKMGEHTATPGRHFVAMTDSGSSLESYASLHNFRRVFINPSDIGGRYSALSYFGMVPAALLGVPLRRVAAAAQTLAAGLQEDSDDNPALALGTFMGAAALLGRDKLTFVPEGRMAAVVPWVEQLVAESTGKGGRGVVPVEGEPPGAPDAYGTDRAFCFIRFCEDTAMSVGRDLRSPGVPYAEIDVPLPEHLGALFLLWEVATSAAGRVLGINPYDEPNVKESKDNTGRLLDRYAATGKLEAAGRSLTGAAFDVYMSGVSPESGEEALPRLLDAITPGDYVSFLYFGECTGEIEIALRRLRATIRDRLKAATLRGFGPRYLHSIGQLYKGGRQNGLFAVIVPAARTKLEIPGSKYGFETLLRAQALGDFEAIAKRERPALLVELKGDPVQALEHFEKTIGSQA